MALQDTAWHPPQGGGALGLHGHGLGKFQHHVLVGGRGSVLLCAQQLLLSWLDRALFQAGAHASCLPAWAFPAAAEARDAARLAQCPHLELAGPARHTELLTCTHSHTYLSCYVALASPGLSWKGRGVHVLWSEFD